MYVRSVFFPTAKATVEEILANEIPLRREDNRLLEVPRDQYHEVVRSLEQPAAAGEIPGVPPASGGIRVLRCATLTYGQAMRVAQAGRVEGVAFEPGTGAVRSACPYGLSFAIDFARARWSGGDVRASVAVALSANLNAGPGSAISGVLAAPLAREDGTALSSVAAGGAISGVTNSPLSRVAIDRATQTLSSVAGAAPSGQLGGLAGANPLVATVAMGVANVDFYRAALARSISWKQFTKNMVVRTTAVLGGASGWASGAVFGSAVGGPFGALIGGIVGGLSGGGLGSAGAKRVADRFVEDDATRMMAIVRRRSEKLAHEYLLTEPEVRLFAERIQGLVTPAWLRGLFQAGRSHASAEGSGELEAVTRLADEELRKACDEIVRGRDYVALPSAETLVSVLGEFGS
jgi:hypothetical protein